MRFVLRSYLRWGSTMASNKTKKENGLRSASGSGEKGRGQRPAVANPRNRYDMRGIPPHLETPSIRNENPTCGDRGDRGDRGLARLTTSYLQLTSEPCYTAGLGIREAGHKTSV